MLETDVKAAAASGVRKRDVAAPPRAWPGTGAFIALRMPFKPSILIFFILSIASMTRFDFLGLESLNISHEVQVDPLAARIGHHRFPCGRVL